MSESLPIYLALGAGVLAVVYGLILTSWILKKSDGNERMREIAAAIQQGAAAYLGRQTRAVAIVAVVVGILLLVVLPDKKTALGFAVGAVLSALAGYVGM